jgi:hypothetical protein
MPRRNSGDVRIEENDDRRLRCRETGSQCARFVSSCGRADDVRTGMRGFRRGNIGYDHARASLRIDSRHDDGRNRPLLIAPGNDDVVDEAPSCLR